MTLAPQHIGIDISKTRLDGFDASASKARRVANCAADIALYLATASSGDRRRRRSDGAL